MKTSLSRRDFIKLASTLPLLPLVKALPARGAAGQSQEGQLPNIFIFLYDALAAQNLSLYNYPRQTSPGLERLAQRATVYHAHHAGANFTTPSTASLFTGVYPWTHRAIDLRSLIHPQVVPNNMFDLLSEAYYQVVFAQNIYADMLLYQFDEHLDRHERLDSFSLVGRTFYNRLAPNDAVHGIKGLDEFIFKREEAHGSLFLSILNDLNLMLSLKLNTRRLAESHPLGLPRLANTDIYFVLQDLTEGMMGLLDELPRPSLGYFHFMPPHSPYLPTSQFYETFDDGWAPPELKRHPLSTRIPQEKLDEQRQTYDEFIANLDFEFGRLLDHMQRTGLLENSYVIVTSDHGEMFERGTHGHSTPLLYDAVTRVPLIISAPGQRERRDVYSPTSNVDLLPSLLQIAGLPLPDWCAGKPLPGLGFDLPGEKPSERTILTMEAKKNPPDEALRKSTVALRVGDLKMVHYQGYQHYQEGYELYDLANDPEELQNLYPDHPDSTDLQAELDARLALANQPFT